MPDYTSILRRSITALPDSRPEMREAVYQRARAALARQLTAVDPPLSTREIERQHQELEGAVSRLEAEFSPPPAPEPVPEPVKPPPQPLAAKRREERPPPPPAPRREERPERDDRPHTRPDRPLAQPPRVEPKAVAPQAAPPAAMAAAMTAAPAKAPPAMARPDQDYDVEDEDDADDYEEDEGSSRAPLLIGLIVVLLVAGLGFYGYTQQDRVLALLGMADAVGESTDAPPAAAPPPVVDDQLAAAEAESDAGKLTDRLTNGSEAPPAELPPPEETATPDAGLTLPVEEDPAGTDAVPPGEAASPSAEQQTAALDPLGQSIVAQRAIYYFQGAQGQPGKATEGTVAWSQISRDSGPAVQATLQMAGQDTTTTVTIYKNNDSGLPASHLVEVQFSGELGASPVQRVPALVLKQTEQARGQPLTGAAVPVTADLFWIALSDDAEQVTRNLQLLRDGSWFDVPILFNDGTRALLTFEKGIPGDKVFETVLSAWTPS